MTATFLLLLVLGLPQVHTSVNLTAAPAWTFNVRCHHCTIINTFNCPTVTTCVYEYRRCMTLAVRINPRELMVYKDCTKNCTFVYAVHQPAETPKHAIKTNSFFFVQCCSGMTCNSGGPLNVERDMLLDEAIEEPLPEQAVRLGQVELLWSLASVLVSSTLT